MVRQSMDKVVISQPYKKFDFFFRKLKMPNLRPRDGSGIRIRFQKSMYHTVSEASKLKSEGKKCFLQLSMNHKKFQFNNVDSWFYFYLFSLYRSCYCFCSKRSTWQCVQWFIKMWLSSIHVMSLISSTYKPLMCKFLLFLWWKFPIPLKK